MLLNITKAKYLGDYRLLLSFNNGVDKVVDLERTIFTDHRKIFEPLQDKGYFQKFIIKFNTVEWQNEVDFAPEFLYEIGKEVRDKQAA